MSNLPMQKWNFAWKLQIEPITLWLPLQNPCEYGSMSFLRERKDIKNSNTKPLIFNNLNASDFSEI